MFGQHRFFIGFLLFIHVLYLVEINKPKDPYHGVYAPNSRFQGVVKRLTAEGERAFQDEARERRYTYWVMWAELLKRTFKEDVERCPVCASTMQRIAFIHTPEAIVALMEYDEQERGPP